MRGIRVQCGFCLFIFKFTSCVVCCRYESCPGTLDEGLLARLVHPAPSHLVVTDLDGTLLDSAARLGRAQRHALEDLGHGGAVRVVATGRSLYSARTVMPADFPIDYLVFSSGAGIMSWADGQLLRSRAMAPSVASDLVARLRALSLDFMVHHAAPDTALFLLLPLDVRQHRLRAPHRALRPFLATPVRRGARGRGRGEPAPRRRAPGDRIAPRPPGPGVRGLARGAHHLSARPRIDLDRTVSCRGLEVARRGLDPDTTPDRPRPHDCRRQRLQRSRHARVGGPRVRGLECAGADARTVRGGPVERRGRVHGRGAFVVARRVIGPSDRAQMRILRDCPMRAEDGRSTCSARLKCKRPPDARGDRSTRRGLARRAGFTRGMHLPGGSRDEDRHLQHPVRPAGRDGCFDLDRIAGRGVGRRRDRAPGSRALLVPFRQRRSTAADRGPLPRTPPGLRAGRRSASRRRGAG